MLDHPGRRSPRASNPYRRALVHDVKDGLTLNLDNDYPGGVTIGGRVRIPVELVVTKLTVKKLFIDDQGKMELVPTGDDPLGPPRIRTTDLDLLEEVNRISARVSALEDKLNK